MGMLDIYRAVIISKGLLLHKNYIFLSKWRVYKSSNVKCHPLDVFYSVGHRMNLLGVSEVLISFSHKI